MRRCGLYFAGPWGVAGLGSTNWLAVTSTQAVVPCEFFCPCPQILLFLALTWSLLDVLMFQLPALLLGTVTRPNFAGRLELLRALPTWDLWHFNTLVVCLSSWANSTTYKRLSTAASLMKKSCLLNELFPQCCRRLGAGRANAVPPRFSHWCAVPAEFPHTSFLASSVNDSLAIFHLLLSSAVG